MIKRLEGMSTEIQEYILKEGDGYKAYIFALDNPGADIEALQAVVMERGDGWDACRFAMKINGADRLPLLRKALSDMHQVDPGDRDWALNEYDRLMASHDASALISVELKHTGKPSSSGL